MVRATNVGIFCNLLGPVVLQIALQGKLFKRAGDKLGMIRAYSQKKKNYVFLSLTGHLHDNIVDCRVLPSEPREDPEHEHVSEEEALDHEEVDAVVEHGQEQDPADPAGSGGEDTPQHGDERNPDVDVQT